MKPKTMILMVVAVACGLGASYMTSRLLADRGKAQPDVPTVPVLVAKVRVPSWQPIKDPEKFFEIRQYPEDVAPKKAIGDMEKVKDQRLRTFLDAEKPLTQDDLVGKDMADLAAQILPGQRATAIKVNAETLTGGFVLPGSRVDVVCTMRGNESSTKVILQNMLILAVDTVDSKNPETKTILGQTVTLAASPEEGARLALAASLGELRLWLRNPGDQEWVKQITVKPADLDKPLPEPKKDGDGSTEEKEEKSGGGGASAKLVIPDLPPDDKKLNESKPPVEEKKPVEEPKRFEEKKPEPRVAKRAQEEDEERPPVPRVMLNPQKPARTHTIFIREGSKERKEQVKTRREDETTEGDDEEGTGEQPAPVKKEEKADKPEQPRDNPAPAKGGSSLKTSRTRTGR
jgi:Flp pilus assembly protein CpaB